MGRSSPPLWAVILAALLVLSQSEPESRVPKLVTLHEDARIFLFSHFLSDEECDHLATLARPRLNRSSVMGAGTGLNTISSIRTSSGMFFRRGEDKVIKRIERRIARWTLLPATNGEGIQVLHYGVGEYYNAHLDFIVNKVPRNGGNRIATVLMYLNDVEAGGETVFPNIPVPEGENGPEYSDCARQNLAVKPQKGTAILFHSLKPSAELEPRSFHKACPIIKGEKWAATKWLHVGRFAGPGEEVKYVELRPQPDGGPPGCNDRLEVCALWAAVGECTANPGFMVGTLEQPGQCLRSCGRCDILEASTQ